jgi:hypothetical protein
MNSRIIAIAAGGLMLGLAGSASAAELFTLSDSQLDNVTAGTATVTTNVTVNQTCTNSLCQQNVAIVFGDDAYIEQSNKVRVKVDIDINKHKPRPPKKG